MLDEIAIEFRIDVADDALGIDLHASVKRTRLRPSNDRNGRHSSAKCTTGKFVRRRHRKRLQHIRTLARVWPQDYVCGLMRNLRNCAVLKNEPRPIRPSVRLKSAPFRLLFGLPFTWHSTRPRFASYLTRIAVHS